MFNYKFIYYNGYFEVVSVSKANCKVTFNNVVWINSEETLSRIEVGCIGFEIVRKFKSEGISKVTVNTDKDFEVGQKISTDDFLHNIDTKEFANVQCGAVRKTGNICDCVIENRMLSCDSDGLWQSDKISTDDVKNLIGFLNEMVKL